MLLRLVQWGFCPLMLVLTATALRSCANAKALFECVGRSAGTVAVGVAFLLLVVYERVSGGAGAGRRARPAGGTAGSSGTHDSQEPSGVHSAYPCARWCAHVTTHSLRAQT